MTSKPNAIDLAEVERLVAALERDLQAVRAGQGDLAPLRAEVEQLREQLAQTDAAPAEMHERLHGVRAALASAGDELFTDAVKGSDYLVRIGRILGM
ncbi:MAG: hypothetical protein ACK5TK_06480 [Betaproteobacteria bacterium]